MSPDNGNPRDQADKNVRQLLRTSKFPQEIDLVLRHLRCTGPIDADIEREMSDTVMQTLGEYMRRIDGVRPLVADENAMESNDRLRKPVVIITPNYYKVRGSTRYILTVMLESGNTDRSKSPNRNCAIERTPQFSRRNREKYANRLARAIGSRLHTFFPQTIFPPEYPAGYDTFYARIGELAEDCFPLHLYDDQSRLVCNACLDATELSKLTEETEIIGSEKGLPPGEAKEMPELITAYGSHLYEWLGTRVTDYLHQAWNEAQNMTPRRGLRLRLCCEAPTVASLAWEYLKICWLPTFADNNTFVAQRTDFLLSRCLEPKVLPATDPPPYLRALAVVPKIVNPNRSEVDHVAERNSIHWGRNNANKQGKYCEESWLEVKIAFFLPEGRWKPTWVQVKNNLRNRLKRHDPLHIFHFIGHGVLDDVTKQTVILGNEYQGGQTIESPYGSAQLIELLSPVEDTLQMIILQSCDTARITIASPIASLAQELAKRYPCVIGLQHQSQQKTMQQFAYGLYLGLGLGHDIDVAVADARRQIASKHTGLRDWGSPVLYLHIFR